MSDSTFTLRVEKQLKEDFIEAAKAAGRPGAQLIRDFMRDYVKKLQDELEVDSKSNNIIKGGQGSSDPDHVVIRFLKEGAGRKSNRHRIGSE